MLIDRLAEYTAVLNLPPQSYTRRHVARISDQRLLFGEQQRCFIVVGPTCAGKTTFGERASMVGDLRWMEASSVVRGFKGEYPETRDSFSLAKALLESRGPDIVARVLLDLVGGDLSRGLVITGFRTIEEVEVVMEQIPGAKLVLVDATERTRFERCLKRRRTPEVQTIQDFRKLDGDQRTFGLLRVAEGFADIRIWNEGQLKDYNRQVDAVLAGRGLQEVPGIATDLTPRHRDERNRLHRCLVALEQAGRPLTCQEISSATRPTGKLILHNNVNKVLKRVPELVRRLEADGTNLRYAILQSGRAYLRVAEQIPLRRKAGREHV